MTKSLDDLDQQHQPPLEDYEVVYIDAVPQVEEIDRSPDASEEQYDEGTMLLSACVTGACLSCIAGLGIPCSCIVGLGSAYGTTQQDTSCGRCSRSMAITSLVCQAKALKLNEDYQIADKTKTAAVACWDKTKDINERHQMTEKVKGCFALGWRTAKETNERYKIVDRTMQGMGRACVYLHDQIVETEGQESNSDTEVTEELSPPEGESRVPRSGEQKNGAYTAVKPDI